jgi:hypothetical protein
MVGTAALSDEARVTMVRAELAASIELQKPRAESVDLLIKPREALWDYEEATGRGHEVEDEFHALEDAIFPDAQ